MKLWEKNFEINKEIERFIKSMVEKTLQDGVEKIADALAQVHYV